MKVILYARYFLLLTLISAFPQKVVSQIYTNSFTGASSCPTPGNVPVVISNASGSGLSRTGVTCNATLSTFNSTTLNNTATITSSYIQFSVTADAGYQLNLTSLNFFRQGSNTAPNQLEVQYSTDGFSTSAYTSWGSAPNTPAVGSEITWNFDDFVTSDGGTVTFRIYPYGTQRVNGAGNAQAGGTFRLDDVILNGTIMSSLPVKLISFNSISEENTILLRWATAWEEKNAGFIIEKSTDAINFENAGYVKGMITLKTRSDYDYRDKEVQPDKIYYYRLKQLDLDGSFEYSRIISAKIPGNKEQEIFLYPNPNHGSFTVKSEHINPGAIHLYNSSGLEIPVVASSMESSNSVLVTSKATLIPGLYHLKINSTKDKKDPKFMKVVVTN